jgi:hypothetical protein
MDPREVAYNAYKRAEKEEGDENGWLRVQKMLADEIDWTIEDVGVDLRRRAKRVHENPEVLAWIDAFIEYHLDLLRYLVELHEREQERRWDD